MLENIAKMFSQLPGSHMKELREKLVKLAEKTGGTLTIGSLLSGSEIQWRVQWGMRDGAIILMRLCSASTVTPSPAHERHFTFRYGVTPERTPIICGWYLGALSL